MENFLVCIRCSSAHNLFAVKYDLILSEFLSEMLHLCSSLYHSVGLLNAFPSLFSNPVKFLRPLFGSSTPLFVTLSLLCQCLRQNRDGSFSVRTERRSKRTSMPVLALDCFLSCWVSGALLVLALTLGYAQVVLLSV